MNVGSLFSGIGGLDHGLARAGFRHAFLCESDPWRREVLAHHFPGVPIYEDVASVGRAELSRRGGVDGQFAGRGHEASEPELPDLLCGGFPCQDVSVAGRRAGLAGERSGLFYEFARIAESLRPRWLLVENVPGLLSSNGGRDFGAVIGTLADIGYGVAWRILDSRYFGVPQRRRRVFILGALADGNPRGAAERAGEILAVGTRCERHPAAGTEARQDVAGTLGGGSGSRGRAQDTERMTFVARSLQGHSGGNDHEAGFGPLVAAPLEAADGHHGYSSPRGDGADNLVIAAPLSHGSNPNSNMAGRRREDDENLVTAFDWMAGAPDSDNEQSGGKGRKWIVRAGDYAGALGKSRHDAIGGSAVGVRRLTPTECERLQALPDGWTDFGPDSRRYAALGDAVTSSVAEFIGRRLLAA